MWIHQVVVVLIFLTINFSKQQEFYNRPDGNGFQALTLNGMKTLDTSIDNVGKSS